MKLATSFRNKFPVISDFQHFPSLPNSIYILDSLWSIPQHTSQVVYAGPLQLTATSRSETGVSESQPQVIWLRQCNHSSSSDDSPLPDLEKPEIIYEDRLVGGPALCRLPAALFPIFRANPIADVFNSELREKIMEAI